MSSSEYTAAAGLVDLAQTSAAELTGNFFGLNEQVSDGCSDVFGIIINTPAMAGKLEVGDLAIVRRGNPELKDGRIVIADIRGQYCPRMIQRLPDGFALICSNEAFVSTEVIGDMPENLAIVGHVIGAVAQRRFQL